MGCIWSTVRCCFVTVPLFLLDGVRLLLYTLVLSPAFVRFAWYYFVSADRTVVRYGTESIRQTLDVYRPTSARRNVTETTNDNEKSQNRHAFSHDSLGGQQTVSATKESTNTNPLPLQEPVVFFCCGGAWMIGYKMWGALLARVLTAAGITVVIPDYRNYPFWGNVPQQVQDVDLALQWTLDHVVADHSLYSASTPNLEQHKASATSLTTTRSRKNVVVVGQSAGGHLLITLMLRKAVEQLRTQSNLAQQEPVYDMFVNDDVLLQARVDITTSSSFVPNDVRGILALSAPLNLSAMQSTFRSHGLDEHLVDRMFGGSAMRDEYDPFLILQSAPMPTGLSPETEMQQNSSLCDSLPPIKIFHGSRDRTVPADGSMDFTQQLRLHNINATFCMYEGWSHTDPILEGPMDADHRFHRDIFQSVLEWASSSSSMNEVDASVHHLQWPGGEDEWNQDGERVSNNTIDDRRRGQVMRPLCPHFLIQLGRICMPF